MIEIKTLAQLKKQLQEKQTFVMNLSATWCSDCTEQSHNLVSFSETFTANNIECVNLVVQAEKNIYLSDEHQAFTESLGGHGFPRTVLVIKGEVADADNVEVISSEQLKALSQKFLQQL